MSILFHLVFITIILRTTNGFITFSPIKKTFEPLRHSIRYYFHKIFNRSNTNKCSLRSNTSKCSIRYNTNKCSIRSNTSNDFKYINIFRNFKFSTSFTDLVSYLTEDLDYKEIYKQIKLKNKNINNYFGDVNYQL